MTIKISITGTLSMPRKAAAQLIESRTNAKFSTEVTYDVSYLVAARSDTSKARRAVELGVTVISEAEMLDFITQGAFPVRSRGQERPRHHTHSIQWLEELEPPGWFRLKYSDSEGAVTERFVRLARRGTDNEGLEYLGAFDGECFKTFRVDRVLHLEEVVQP